MENDPANSNYIIAFGSAAAGALFGSVSTYVLGRRQQKLDEDNRRHGALINTQFALFSQVKVVDGLKANYLDPVRDEPDRFTKLGVTVFIKSPLNVPLNELAFIASSKSPNLIQEISDAEQSYLKTLQVLDLFNQFHIEFEKTHSPIPGTLNPAKLQPTAHVIADKLEIKLLKFYVDNIYKEVDLATPKLYQTIEKVSEFIKQNFKGKKAIKIESEKGVHTARHP